MLSLAATPIIPSGTSALMFNGCEFRCRANRLGPFLGGQLFNSCHFGLSNDSGFTVHQVNSSSISLKQRTLATGDWLICHCMIQLYNLRNGDKSRTIEANQNSAREYCTTNDKEVTASTAPTKKRGRGKVCTYHKEMLESGEYMARGVFSNTPGEAPS